MTEEKVNLGEVPQRVGMRDAVHVAVIGAVTAHRMAPGSRVGLTESGELSMVASPVVGVVDPYLPPGEIPPGTTVWLCLLPGTVTGMRHVWSAPGFEVRPPGPGVGAEKGPSGGLPVPGGGPLEQADGRRQVGDPETAIGGEEDGGRDREVLRRLDGGRVHGRQAVPGHEGGGGMTPLGPEDEGNPFKCTC